MKVSRYIRPLHQRPVRFAPAAIPAGRCDLQAYLLLSSADDDQEVAQHLNPGLTTVLLPHREMGQWAVEFLLSPGDTNTNRTVKLECPLVMRDSI
ncbi:substrate-binding domain-containing protein [Marinimicrobium sp. C2-29]|uniref:substrate-binding domain-containing protein n=1 Tax=Marinimicrobium sp. C2-29 TaxID=3139825 RepID=UPI00405350D3